MITKRTKSTLCVRSANRVRIQTDQVSCSYINRGSYKSARVLLNLLNELGKREKCEACRAFYLFCCNQPVSCNITDYVRII